MSVIAFTGIKGGVGVTTIAVNVAGLLSTRRETALVAMNEALDWSLHLRGKYARADRALPEGWKPAAPAQADVWSSVPGPDAAMKCLALGVPEDGAADYAALEKHAFQPFAERGLLVADLPDYKLRRVMSLCPIGVHVRVVGADAVSMTAAIQQRDAFDESVAGNEGWSHYYLLNMIDPRRQLCRDLEAIAQEAFGGSLLARLRFDASVSNAAADGQLVADHAPHCQAAGDLNLLTDKIEALAPDVSVATSLSA